MHSHPHPSPPASDASERPKSSWSCQESGRGSAHLWHRTSQRLRQPSPSGRNPNKPASSRRHSSRHLPPATPESTVQKRPARFLMPAFLTSRNLPLRHERQPTRLAGVVLSVWDVLPARPGRNVHVAAPCLHANPPAIFFISASSRCRARK